MQHPTGPVSARAEAGPSWFRHPSCRPRIAAVAQPVPRPQLLSWVTATTGSSSMQAVMQTPNSGRPTT